MKASEAKALSEKYEYPLEKILKDIENTAKQGCRQQPAGYITEATRMELMRLGYKISVFTDQIGIEGYMINW